MNENEININGEIYIKKSAIKNEQETFMSVEACASMLNCHAMTIKRYIKQGLLEAIKLKRDWRVKRSSILKLIDKEGK